MQFRRLLALKHRFAREFQGLSKCSSFTKQIPNDANIKILSDMQLIVKPYDVVTCPDSNLLRISLHPLDCVFKGSEITEDFETAVKIKGQNVVIDTLHFRNDECDSVKCLVEVPVRANLDIIAEEDVEINDMHSDVINVHAASHIQTKDLASTKLILTSRSGSIICNGITLAKEMDLRNYYCYVIN